MDIADLLDTKFEFACIREDDAPYWDYSLEITYFDEVECSRSMTPRDVQYLRNNCRKILAATEGLIQDSAGS